jgi:hypothetical protein
MFDRLSVIASLCFVSVLSTSATGCSSSDSGGPAPADGGTDTAKSDVGGTDTKVAEDTAPADTAPAICWFVKATKPEELKCDDCSEVKCKAEREECFGPSYLDGKTFGGSCKDYITCQCGCRESDATCQEACKISSTKACQDCETKVDTCEKAKCGAECDPPL